MTNLKLKNEATGPGREMLKAVPIELRSILEKSIRSPKPKNIFLVILPIFVAILSFSLWIDLFMWERASHINEVLYPSPHGEFKGLFSMIEWILLATFIQILPLSLAWMIMAGGILSIAHFAHVTHCTSTAISARSCLKTGFKRLKSKTSIIGILIFSAALILMQLAIFGHDYQGYIDSGPNLSGVLLIILCSGIFMAPVVIVDRRCGRRQRLGNILGFWLTPEGNSQEPKNHKVNLSYLMAIRISICLTIFIYSFLASSISHLESTAYQLDIFFNTSADLWISYGAIQGIPFSIPHIFITIFSAAMHSFLIGGLIFTMSHFYFLYEEIK